METEPKSWLELVFWSWLRSAERKLFKLLHVGTHFSLYVAYLSKFLLPTCLW